MDSITKSLLNSFKEKFGFPNDIEESTLFEHFVSYSLLYRKIEASLKKDELENISTGKSKGIDTIACCINNKLILDKDEFSDFDKQRINVDIYFFQSKTTEGFSDTEATNFLDIVIYTLKEQNPYNSQEINHFLEIYSSLLKGDVGRMNFNLYCAYVSLGVEQTNENTIKTTIELKQQQLMDLNLFTSIKIDLIGKSALIQAYKKAINPLRASFKFERHSSITSIPSVKEAYIGYVPFSEFKNLIMDEDGSKYKSLFEDNLRDFYGINNPVNDGIKNTLEQGRFGEFSLLNNGVTVIADANNGKSNTFVLENYQIVNGCQTSNVLYLCKDLENIDNVLVPLKVVITEDSELRDRIILSTNSQTRFEESELFALTEFQKTLEDYYLSQELIDHIYYERRTNQYESMGLTMLSIVDIKEQLKAFMAMFYDMPYLVAGNIGKVIKTHKDKFFRKEHNPLSYYIAGLLSKKWDKLLKEKDMFRDMNKYRYHIFMGFRYLIEKIPFHSEYIVKTGKYSIKIDNKQENINFYDELLKTIRNESEFESTINKVVQIFKKLDYGRPKGAYSNPLNQEFIEELKKHESIQS